MATVAHVLQHSQRFESSRVCASRLSTCSQAISALVSCSTTPTTATSMMGSPSTFEGPLTLNTDPFQSYSELKGRKRNKLNATSRSSSWTNISASSRSYRAPAEYTPLSEQDSSRPDNWHYDFTNPVEMVPPGCGLSVEYESPSSLSIRHTGLELPTGQLDEHHRRHFDHPQSNIAWSEDCGVYDTAVAPQISAKWPVEFGTGYFDEGYAPQRTEQWLR